MYWCQCACSVWTIHPMPFFITFQDNPVTFCLLVYRNQFVKEHHIHLTVYTSYWCLLRWTNRFSKEMFSWSWNSSGNSEFVTIYTLLGKTCSVCCHYGIISLNYIWEILFGMCRECVSVANSIIGQQCLTFIISVRWIKSDDCFIIFLLWKTRHEAA